MRHAFSTDRSPARLSAGLCVLLAALTVAGCARRSTQTYTMIDPATGQQIQVMAAPQTYAQAQAPAPVYAQQPQYQTGQQYYAQQPASGPQSFSLTQTYIPPQVQETVAPPAPAPQQGRGLFSGSPRATYQQQPQAQQPYVVQYGGGQAYVQQPPAQVGGPYQASPNAAYASAYPGAEPAYTLDAGDRLRIVVFGQDGISNSYLVDAGGNVNMPLIGTIAARGTTPQQLAQLITTRLKQGFVREPHVTVEVEAYRPFFILGEVTNPGQYAYVANMTAETAIAIAGGFAPRANKSKIELTRSAGGQQIHGDVPLNYPLRPGDTVVVKERWF
jgi:protein involved in polysaccharide export with SLBB domain